VTPPSVRFLGRKVYLAPVIILISAMRQGSSPRRLRELSARFGADERTITRWQVFWRDLFPQTHFWKIARARLEPLVTIVSLPYSLVDAFLHPRDPCTAPLRDEAGDGRTVDPSPLPAPETDWARLLRFLAPISIPGAFRIEVSR
jgi:hypothetical protein